jgi:protein SCO1
MRWLISLALMAALAVSLAASGAAAQTAQTERAAQQAAQARNRAHFPNTILQDQNGRRLRFYDDVLRGKVFAINFVYTTCTDVCPLDTAQLRNVQRLLGDRLGRDIFMYTVSVNADTPEAMRRFMRTYDVGPGWTFLTASRAEVVALQRSLGLRVTDPDDLRAHNTNLVIGNEGTGQFVRRSAYENPQNIVELLTVAMQNHAPNQPRTSQSYAAAGEIVDNSRGSYLFRTRCQACHTIGEGDRLGPDLAGVVAARPPAWLSRWLREPDRMIAERDPAALALLARYRNLPMPNLSLGEPEAADIIEYMRLQDAGRVAGHTPRR